MQYRGSIVSDDRIGWDFEVKCAGVVVSEWREGAQPEGKDRGQYLALIRGADSKLKLKRGLSTLRAMRGNLISQQSAASCLTSHKGHYTAKAMTGRNVDNLARSIHLLLLSNVMETARQRFFPSNAFMALARSFNMFYCMLQDGIN